MKDEIKVIKLLQDEAKKVNSIHSDIGRDLNDIKKQLQLALDNGSYLDKKSILPEIGSASVPLNRKSFSEIVEISNYRNPSNVGFRDIITDNDLLKIDSKVNSYIEAFNKKHQLDNWDYAIGGGVGLFCGILDVLFVKKPLKPTVNFSQQADGLFNQWSQDAINKLLPPNLSKLLEKKFKIGGADARLSEDLLFENIDKFNPINHRFKALGHDPVLAFFIGALDVMNGTCTIIDNGSIKVVETLRGSTGDYSFFESLGMMLGHLASDFNTPSGAGNRGMGIPAPLMSLFGCLKGMRIGDQDVADLAEFMYIKGYDSRHFVTMSIPVLISEILIRVLYIVKEMKENNRGFFDIFKETLSFNISHRFRMILNISYGTMVAINAGKVAMTKNILDANYTMWVGFTWHTYHSLHWLLWERSSELQKNIDDETSKELRDLQRKINDLTCSATTLMI